MTISLRKAFSIIALSAIFIVSFVSVCKQMPMSCGFDGSHETMGGMDAGLPSTSCTQDGSACFVSMNDHMTIFAGTYPSTGAAALMSVVVLAVAFIIVRFWRSAIESAEYAKLRSRLRSLERDISNLVAPNFLVFAFSRGILHSKIYA